MDLREARLECSPCTNLGDEVEVGDEGGLQDDGHVGGVEELDGVRALLAPGALGAHREHHTEALQGGWHQSDGRSSLRGLLGVPGVPEALARGKQGGPTPPGQGCLREGSR